VNELTKELIAIHETAAQAQIAIAQAQAAVAEHRLRLAQTDNAKTMALLRALKSGAVALDQVTLDGDRWAVVEVNRVEPKHAPEG
jgi:hypothetical protein